MDIVASANEGIDMKWKHRLLPATALAWACSLSCPAQAMDLMDAWEKVRQFDPQMSMAQATLDSSQALSQQASSLWRPSVMANATAAAMGAQSRMNGAEFAAPGFGQSNGVNFSTSVNHGLTSRWALQLRQPLYNREREAQQQQLHLGTQASELDADRSVQGLMISTAQRYFEVVLAELKQVVLSQQYEAVKRAQTEAQDRYELGDAPITDVHEASARARALQALLTLAENEVQMARVVLGDSTGVAASALQVQGLSAQRLDVRPPALDDVLSAVRQGSVELRWHAVQLDVVKQEVLKHQTRAAPTVDAVAALGRDHLSGQGDFGAASTTQSQQMLGISVSLPLYTGGWRDGKLKEAMAAQDKAVAAFDATSRQVFQQARATWMALESGQARLSALEAALDASQARLEATRLGRQVGDRTTLELLAAENDKASAVWLWTQARTEVLVNQLRLDAQMGRLTVQSLKQINTYLTR